MNVVDLLPCPGCGLFLVLLLFARIVSLSFSWWFCVVWAVACSYIYRGGAVVYGLQPIGPMELAPHPTIQQFSGDAEVRAKEIKKLHEEVLLKIEKNNAKYVEQANRRRKYVEFEVGELVWVHLRKDRFLFFFFWINKNLFPKGQSPTKNTHEVKKDPKKRKTDSTSSKTEE